MGPNLKKLTLKIDLMSQCNWSTGAMPGLTASGQVAISAVNTAATPIPVPVPLFSFTGSRGSKLGDLGPYGKQVVMFYTQTKTITQRWPSAGVREGAVFSFPSSR